MDKKNLVLENATIVFRNFEGKEGKFNPAGRRNFCVLLEEDIAKDLKDHGWNIKYLSPREEGDTPQAYLQVSLNYNSYAPNVYLVSSRGKNRLDEEDVKILDWADLANVDMVIRPYEWEVNGKKGIKAYLKTMYAVIEESPLEEKYINTPDSAENTIGGCGNCEACDGSCRHEFDS